MNKKKKASSKTNKEETPLPQNIKEVDARVADILSQYGSRQMGEIVVTSLLEKIPLELAKDWLQSRKIVTREDFKKKLSYLQSRYRKLYLEASKKESEALEAEYEAWLFEKDPEAAAGMIVDKMRSDILNKMHKKGW